MRSEFSYNTSYVMPELVTTQIFFNRAITIRLLEQGYVATRLKSLQKFYGCYHELVDRYSVSICSMKMICFSAFSSSTPDQRANPGVKRIDLQQR